MTSADLELEIKDLPELDIEATLALIIETIDAVDGGTLMVATQEEEVFGVLDLVC
jgi:hypothetical protein